MSYHLKQSGIDHVILEKHQIAHSWKTKRWDAFCLVTPNWQCRLPGYPYQGSDPKGFMLRDEIVAYIENYAKHIAAPIREGVAVTRLTQNADGGFALETSAGEMTAGAVVLAVSGYHVPNVPRMADRLDGSVTQLHSAAYRSPEQLPPGEVIVIGSGQSGCQIAEDLHLAGRKVHLAVGSAPRCPRVYRGRDAVEWLDDLGQYDLPVDQHGLKEKVRKNANHYLTGRDGGRDIDLRKFALEGMSLYGRLKDIEGGRLIFADDLAKNLDNADRVYNGICGLIDDHIARNTIDAPASPHYAPVWAPTDTPAELDPAQGRHFHHHLDHRLPVRLVVGRAADLRRRRLSDPSARRDVDGRRLCARPALALHLGLGTLRRRRSRCGLCDPAYSGEFGGEAWRPICSECCLMSHASRL